MSKAIKKKKREEAKILTLSRLGHANWEVIAELEKLGFYDQYTEKTEVYLTLWEGKRYAYQLYRSDGSICVPRVSWQNLKDHYNGKVENLRDVLRHEYGHAVADTHRGLMRSKKFTDAFGAAHDPYGAESEYDPDSHVTYYAGHNTGEDFAEIFYLFLKHKGKLPKRFQKPSIQKKWRFVEQLRNAIKSGHRRWS